MNIYRYILSLLCVISILLIAGCDGEPVFTEMSTNRLKIVLKGTLESETPAAFNLSVVADDSVDDFGVQAEDVVPTTFMFDISEIKLNGKAIGNYRQVFSIPLNDVTPFFSGTGITLKNDDPGNGSYSSVQLYIRKMIFDNAQIYTSTGTDFEWEEIAQVIFHEDEVNGFNFNNLQVNSYWDSLRDNASSINRIYPVDIPIIGGMNYDRDNDQTVLEIRLVIKNFIKMYEYDYYDDGIFKVCHFYGLSDWLRDVREDESDMGRNIHAVARAYVPGKTGTISGTGTSGYYVMAIPSSYTDDSEFYLSASGSSLRSTLVPNYDMPVAPVYSGVHIESVLDYYCNYEKYKSDWNAIVGTYNDFDDADNPSDNYCMEWEAYEGAVENYKIAPYMTIINAGNYSFSNVAPGTYKVYTHSAPGTNSLFQGAWTQIGTATVTAGNNVTVP